MQHWSKMIFEYVNKIRGEARQFVLTNKLDEKSKTYTILKTGFDTHNTILKTKEKLEGPILENIQNLRNVEEKKK